MAFYSLEEFAEEWGQGEREDGDSDCGKDCPKNECVPLPKPQLAGESDGVFAGGMEEFVCGERHRRGVEDAACDTNERNYENEFKRINDVVAELRGGHIETKENGYCEAEDRGAPKNGVDADKEAGGDAPGELFRRGSHAKKCQDGKGDAAVEPVVMDGGCWNTEIGFAGLH
jgi:hypothetical protein